MTTTSQFASADHYSADTVRNCYLFLNTDSHSHNGRWAFKIVDEDGDSLMAVDDIEPGVSGERLELLTVVRALESLDQPSHVVLFTQSSYVREGFRNGLRQWRSEDWKWEYYDRMVPIRDEDLWRRVDRALQFHEVDCRIWRFDPTHDDEFVEEALHGASAPHADFARSGRRRTRAMDQIVLGVESDDRANRTHRNPSFLSWLFSAITRRSKRADAA